MKPDGRFLKQPKSFWANVRSISEQIGYTDRRTGMVKVPSFEAMCTGLTANELGTHHLINESGLPNQLGLLIHDYFTHRANVLNTFVEPRLMDVQRVDQVHAELASRRKPRRPVPMNKQRGSKAKPLYFTGIINAIIEANIGDLPCDYDPRGLTSVTRNGLPLRTLSRRLDGAFPRMVNPVAVWEIKEYYYTTSFGSRVADGVYETLLDGMEIEELREHESIDVQHYLMIDAHYT